MHRNVLAVVDAARARGLAVEPVEFPTSTRTAADAAAALGVPVGRIVKSLVFTVGGRLVLALASGANQVDERLLAEAAGTAGRARRADPEAVRTATGFPIGGVPPLGHTTELPVFLDEDLLEHEQVWAAAGTATSVFPVSPAVLVAVTGATVRRLARA